MSHFILQGNDPSLGVGDECLTVAAIMSTGGNVFYRGGSKENKLQSDKMKIIFSAKGGDLVSALQAFKCWEAEVSDKSKEERDEWCMKHYILSKTMDAALRIRKEMRNRLAQLGIIIQEKPPFKQAVSMSDCSDESHKGDATVVRDKEGAVTNISNIRRAIADGFFQNLAVSNGPKAGYTTLDSDQACMVHPSSTLVCTNEFPQFILYHELALTSRLFMRGNTAVEKSWIRQINPAFYDMIESRLVDRDAFDCENISISSSYILLSIIGKRGSVIFRLQKQFNCVIEPDTNECMLRVWATKSRILGAKSHIEVSVISGRERAYSVFLYIRR